EEGETHDSDQRRTGPRVPQLRPEPPRRRRAPRCDRPGARAPRAPARQPARGDPAEVSEWLLVPRDQPDQRPQRDQRRLPDPHRAQDPSRPAPRRGRPRGRSHERRSEGGPSMTLDANDPRLTAYALGELDEAARAEVEDAIAGLAEALQFVAE